jgi:hypothetical protein
MAIAMITVLALLVIAVVLFVTEKFPIALVALMIMSTLLLTGIVARRKGLPASATWPQ